MESENRFPHINGSIIRNLCPSRPVDGHKKTFGSVMLWAGSAEYAGAAHMCAMGALRSGVGLVTLLTSAHLMPYLSAVSPPVITRVRETKKEIYDLSDFWEDKHALVAGPGLLPEEPGFIPSLEKSIQKAKNLVLDAGALTFIGENPRLAGDWFGFRNSCKKDPAVVTPHPGEFAKLTSGGIPQHREKAAREYAGKHNVVVVLKGENTVVASPDGRGYINPTGNDGMAKGGSGDVLAGLIGGFMAQGMDPFSAACCGVYFHGLAGDLAAEKLGKRYMQPTDMISFFSEAYRRCGW